MFIHHPDNQIIIQGSIFPIEFWQIVEPNYALPQGYIGRLFTSGHEHKLICEGNATDHPADKNDPILTGYVARREEYEAAYAAYQNVAQVENVNGQIIMRDRQLLTLDKAEIIQEAQGIDTYDISIVPDQDCCTLFVPRHPATRAVLAHIEAAEAKLDMSVLIDIALAKLQTHDYHFPPALADHAKHFST